MGLKYKFGFIDVTIKTSAHTNALYSTWKRANMMVVY